MDIDLTSPDAARQSFEESGVDWQSFLPGLGVIPSGSDDPFWMYQELYKLGRKSLQVAKHVLDRGEVRKKEAEVIERVIQKGAEAGVDEMTVKLTKEQAGGLNLKGLGDAGNAKVTLGLNGETVVELNIKYQARQAAV